LSERAAAAESKSSTRRYASSQQDPISGQSDSMNTNMFSKP